MLVLGVFRIFGRVQKAIEERRGKTVFVDVPT